MLAITLSYIVLLLLIGIHQKNKSIIVFTISYFIIMMIVSRSSIGTSPILELLGLSIVTLIWTFLYKSVETFQDIPTRDCTIYFTDYVKECDQNDFIISDIEFENKIKTAQISANNLRNSDRDLYKKVMDPMYIVSKPEVTVTQKIQNTEKNLKFILGNYSSVSKGVTSIYVGKDTRIYLYDETNFNGTVIHFTGPIRISQKDLSKERFNKPIASFKVTYHPIAYYKYLLNLKEERERLNGVCKQEFPGWKEIATHPMKTPSDVAIRGNLRDWGFCYRELFDRNSTGIYDSDTVGSQFEEYRALFGNHSLVEPEKKYIPLLSNSNLTYNKASPEYIRIYFKNTIVDPPATCENPTVDYKPKYPVLSPQYGFEFGITSPSVNNYILKSISIIKTASPNNGYSFMYEGEYNRPDPSTFLDLLFDYKMEGNRIIVVSKPNIELNNKFIAYRFYFDICNKLTYIGNPASIINSIAAKIASIPTQQRIIYQGDYPFNQAETYTGININSYDATKINEQNQILQDKIQENLTIIQQEESKFDINKVDVPSNQEGFIRRVYKIPNNTKVSNRDEMDQLERNSLQNSENEIEYRLFRFTNPYGNRNELSQDVIYNNILDLPIKPLTSQKTRKTAPNYSTLQVYTGNFQTKTYGEYMFRFLLHDLIINERIDNLGLPLNFMIDMVINNQLVSSLYYCSEYDTCIQTKSSNICDVKTLCKPKLSEYISKKPHLQPIEATVTITQPINTIRVRIVTNVPILSNDKYDVRNKSITYPLCRLMYKRVNDPLKEFRILRYQRYDDDIIFYKNSDYSIERENIFKKQKENDEMQRQIERNNELNDTISTNTQPIVTSILNNLLNQDASWLNITNIQKYLSENNRLYMFFYTPREAPLLSDAEEKQKIIEFNQTVRNS